MLPYPGSYRTVQYPGRVTLSRVSNYPYLYILYSTLRYELWKLGTVLYSSTTFKVKVLYCTVPGPGPGYSRVYIQ